MTRNSSPNATCAEEKRKAEAELEAKLLDGVASPERELAPTDWRAMRNEALAQIEVRRRQR